MLGSYGKKTLNYFPILSSCFLYQSIVDISGETVIYGELHTGLFFLLVSLHGVRAVTGAVV